MNKSGKTKMIEEFWVWFRGVAQQIAVEENSTLLAELDTHIRQLAPELSWEIGPGLVAPRQLVISPNLDRNFRAVAKEIISQAPPSLPSQIIIPGAGNCSSSRTIPTTTNLRAKNAIQRAASTTSEHGITRMDWAAGSPQTEARRRSRCRMRIWVIRRA